MSDDTKARRIVEGPTLQMAEEWLQQWSAAHEDDEAAYQALLPMLEELSEKYPIAKLAPEVIFAWLEQVDPFTLQEAIRRLPAIDMRYRLDARGLQVYLQGYVDGYAAADTKDYERH